MNFRVLTTMAACSVIAAAAPAQAHASRHHHHHHHGMTAKHDRMADHKISDSDHHNNDPTAPSQAPTSH